MSVAEQDAFGREISALRRIGGEDVVVALRQVRSQMESVHQLQRSLSSLSGVVSPATASRAQATENAWRGIGEEFGLLSADQVAGRVGARRGYASDARRAGRLLGVKRLNRVLYPGFQVTAAGPLPVIRQVHDAARRQEVPEEAALLWFVAPTTWWGDDRRPVDHLDDPEGVLAAFTAHHGVEW